MTPTIWEVNTDPGWMLSFLRNRCSARKLRQFACACCRENWSELSDPTSRAAVEAAERFIDDQILSEELELAWRHAARIAFQYDDERADPAMAAAYAAYSHFSPHIRGISNIWISASEEGIFEWTRACMTLFIERPHSPRPIGSYHAQQEMRRRTYADLLREVIGNPFRTMKFASDWSHDSVAQLAQAYHHQPDASIPPILADALMERGCDDAELLDHLRSPGPHVKGCWAMDWILESTRSAKESH
ncbi:hypothetical protein [Tuwongella immobilis]|uniref:Uncharacterized protein n=1 Tax=Tuwongella immobilis TaxID=692036 RepID=A0A6C2YJA5_9BACT|nr:hypothetical protein [Tuwongella immobilis]VIP01361.1 Uncharacterized protein OS=Sorangium cellulosum (strain So ce56) GN=sce5710 PE=4 SV=1 [Tuwongella immobilis]VTR98176.1 Uncharacterized protein OS=Sorangium cellulosum (strain So ce56) GN=sce5710 PE=4 SV=1 [Tuwongella immobilis]